MSPERLQELEQKGIFCDWLCRIPFQYRIDEISRYTYEPLETKIPIEGPGLPEQVIGGGWNPRVATASGAARERCAAFVSQAMSSFRLAPEERKVLILGTEECMAPGLFLGQALEKEHPELTVRFHAATRSPIDVSLDPEYPLHRRFPLDSLYEEGRHTFLYNLAAYDRIILVTDAPTVSPGGSASIRKALERCGNHENMTLLVWREDSHA